MPRSTRKRFRRLLLASTLTLLGATEPTRGQEAAPIAATQAAETFPAGTQAILGRVGEDYNMPVFASGEAMLKYSAILNKGLEADDVAGSTRDTINLINSGEMHMYKSGTPCTIVKVITVGSFPKAYVVRVKDKKWVTLGVVLHLPGTAPPVVATPKENEESLPAVATPKESKESLLEKRHGFAGMTYRIDGDNYFLITHDGTSAVVHCGPGRTTGVTKIHDLGPNKAQVSGWFKFLANAEGTNAMGGKINIEVYEPFTDEETRIMTADSDHAKKILPPTAATDAAEKAGKTAIAEHKNKQRKTDKATHEARKARAAYLVQYIIDTGNEIDQLNASGWNPRNYWKAIVEVQDELLDIYQSELVGTADDPNATRVLQSNITKITRGREFARNAINESNAPLPLGMGIR